MQGAAGEDENMPDGVVPIQFLPGIEDSAQGVAQAPSYEQGQPPGGQAIDEGLDGNDHQPAHAQIEEQGPALPALAGEHLDIDAENGDAPDHAEQRPAPGAMQGHQSKGCIGAGNEQENGGVIQFLQPGLGPFMGDAVVEGGCRVKENQSGAVDRSAGDMPGVTVEG